jgi:hypothetical protein
MVFGSRMLNILGTETDEVRREWRRLHNKELNDLYSSSDISRVIKSTRRWVRRLASMEVRKGACRGLVEKYQGRHHF